MRSPDAIVAEKRAAALGLRAQGKSYREIAAVLAISHQSANEYCNEELHARANKRRRNHYRASPQHQEATAERLRERRRNERAATTEGTEE